MNRNVKEKTKSYQFIVRSEDFVYFPNLGLVLQENKRIKVRNVIVCCLAHEISFTLMLERSHLYFNTIIVQLRKKSRPITSAGGPKLS